MPGPEEEEAGRAWTVGLAPAPAAVDPSSARARRLEARLAVYAQYAAVTAEQAAAVLVGDDDRAAALAAERATAAEHFDELRAAPVGDPGAASAIPFCDALTDALAELAHQGAVDAALQRRLGSLQAAVQRGAGWASAVPALAPGAAPSGARLDVRF